ncbi:hypothetical protein INS49_008986 [Diaporthe citri]|uniref:uncharacterized protein n=1 Tax=Diaporthe citri TaxID=83186 RepID=UPI001C821696|nr:uncharacterized protein INS49_008986 [Diaporthe citri]KAG6363883.1 hypothetical protein INS49_008986 [Diaporthe citri]
MRLRPFLDEKMELENLSVPAMMATARELTLSNPADGVFAFLSIADEISQSTLHVKADHSKTPQSVYTELAVAYLQATRDLDLLKYVQHTNESIELSTPSWVPLWDINEWEVPEGSEDGGLTRKQGSPADFTLEQGSGTPRLTVQAVLLGTVRFASDPLLLETVQDVAQLWQIIRHVDESADIDGFLQVLSLGCTTEISHLYTTSFSCSPKAEDSY